MVKTNKHLSINFCANNPSKKCKHASIEETIQNRLVVQDDTLYKVNGYMYEQKLKRWEAKPEVYSERKSDRTAIFFAGSI